MKIKMPCGQDLEEEVKFFYNPKDEPVLKANKKCLECGYLFSYYIHRTEIHGTCYGYKLAGVVQLAER